MCSLIKCGTAIKYVAEKWNDSSTTIYRYLEKQ
ncbi:helix-turn-helix domain-containing protein [Psychrobacillus sp. MER TA 171]|nr:helix-turn-helix domain-containing protein [Psychrobacillus sp. MER TA 171]MCM3358654.1 helix-turn-helix domain-containing protein [Psychrobacillus sp. MER TA 171]